MSNKERYQAQLDRCCRRQFVVHKPLTGIQKQRIEEEEARAMWNELKEEL